MLIEEISILDRIPVIPLTTMEILLQILIIEEFINSQKVFNTTVEEKLHMIDTLAKNMDRIALDVETLKNNSLPPKHDFNENIKSIQLSINESKERTAKLKAKREFLEKALPPGFYRNHDEDLKMPGTYPIESVFNSLNINDKGTEDESTLASERPACLEGDDFNAKTEKSGLGEVKTLSSDVPTIFNYKDFNYES